ncbi:MAG: hypothetical protein K2X82_04600 [Gemmataceae bacterium]|nr:hypothetical protein [Gemmataceae bacterium]
MDHPEPTHTAEALRAIARHQRHALIAVGLQVLVLVVGAALVRAAGTWGPTAWRWLMVLIAAVLAATVLLGVGFALLLGARASGAVTGLVLGALAGVPVIGLAAVLGACAAGTGVLRRHGVRVGPLGASRDDLAELENDYGDDRPDEDEGW